MPEIEVCFALDYYRVIKTKKGLYRIQLKKKRTLKDILLFRQRWLTLIVDYDNVNKAKATIFIKEYKDVQFKMKELNKALL